MMNNRIFKGSKPLKKRFTLYRSSAFSVCLFLLLSPIDADVQWCHKAIIEETSLKLKATLKSDRTRWKFVCLFFVVCCL